MHECIFFWSTNAVDNHTKHLIYMAILMNLFDSENRTLTKRIIKELDVCHMRCIKNFGHKMVQYNT